MDTGSATSPLDGTTSEQAAIHLQPPTTPAFMAEWSPSKTAALDPLRVQLAEHIPRAWERAPFSPATEDSRFKKVWKCNSTRPQPSNNASAFAPVESQKQSIQNTSSRSPQRPIKRLRIGSGSESEGERSPTRGRSSATQYVATSWDENSDVLPRKQQNPVAYSLTNAESTELIDVSEETSTAHEQITGYASSTNVEHRHTPGASDAPITTEGNGQPFCNDEVAQVLPEPVPEVPSILQDNNSEDSEETQSEMLLEQGTQKSNPRNGQDSTDVTVDSTVERELDILREHMDAFESRVNAHDTPQDIESSIECDKANSSILVDIEEDVLNAVTKSHPTADAMANAEHELDFEPALETNPREATSDVETTSPSLDGDDMEINHKAVMVETTPKTVDENRAEQHEETPSMMVSTTVVEFDVPPIDKEQSEDKVSNTLANKVPISLSPHRSSVENQVEVLPSSSGFEFPELPKDMLNASTSSPVEEAATATLTSQYYLEEEKAYLESFLNRAAASKASKTAVTENDENCTRRETVQNRRDSDAIRQALASPGRLPLENKDGNLFSPKKGTQKTTFDDSPSSKKAQTATDSIPELILPSIDDMLAEQTKVPEPRRSVRSLRTRSIDVTAVPPSGPHQISLRRGDGTETLTFALSKTESQQVMVETRKNTRRNKGNAVGVVDRLVKWQAEVTVLGKGGPTPEPRATNNGEKGVRWSESLEFLNDATGKPEEAPLINNEQAPTVRTTSPSEGPAEQGDSTVSVAATKQTLRSTRSSTSKVRRLRGLGAANGTPSKGVLSSTLLPEEVEEQKVAAKAVDEDATLEGLVPKTLTMTSKIGKARKTETTCVVTTATESKVIKSRLQPPKKLSLNPTSKSVTPLTTAEAGDQGATKVLASKIQAPTVQKGSMLPVAGTQKKRVVRRA